MFVFNLSVGSLEQGVKLGRLGNFQSPRQFPFLNTTFFQSFNQLLLLWWRKKTFLKRQSLFRSQISAYPDVATSKARI